jgi:hypothetical protein
MKTLKKLFASPRPQDRAERRFRPAVESLEERRVLSVTYHGGAVLSNVQAQALYLGSDWLSNSTYYSQSRSLDSFLGNVVNSSYLDMLGNAYGSRTVLPNGYPVPAGTPGGYVTTPSIGRGSALAGGYWNYNIDKTQYLSDSTIRYDLVNAIGAGKLLGPRYLGSNNLYVAYVEDNVAVSNSAGTSVSNFTAYHYSFSSTLYDPYLGSSYGADIHYAVIAYPAGSVPLSSGTVSNNQWSFLTTVNGMTLAASHELAEAVTDPDPRSGWNDDSQGEIGDVSNAQTVFLNGYAVQREADPNDQAMTPAGARAATPINFVLDNSGNLSMGSGSSLTPVASGVASISDQSIDDYGNAMIDVVFTNGSASEYHAGSSGSVSPNSCWSQYLRGGVRAAKAGQGVSYLLNNSGNVQEYKDWGGGTFKSAASWTNIDTTGRVTALDAGTDGSGVNMVAEVRTDWLWNGSYVSPQSDGYEISDSTGSHSVYLGSPYLIGGLTLSAGQQGNIGILWYGTAIWYNEATGNSFTQDTGVAEFTMGTDQNGGVQFDMLHGNGTLTQYSASNGWLTLQSFQSISKAHAGVLDVLYSEGYAYAYDTASNGWQWLGSNVAAAA